MRDFILLFVNGVERRVTGDDAFAPLSTVLRGRIGLVGTKLVCSEGDCGACTVLVGRPDAGRIRYEVVNSCIFFVHQADGAHVVTVEGLADEETLSGVQQAIVNAHGIQCGFCTPGFALSLTGLVETTRLDDPSRSSRFTQIELQRSLAGNLCRCTGYLQLLEAGASLSPRTASPLSDHYPDAPLVDALETTAHDPVRISVAGNGTQRTLHMPNSIDDLLSLRALHPEALLVSGATDIGVQCNLGDHDTDITISLQKIEGLSGISIADGTAVVGAKASWTRIASALEDVLPQGREPLNRFGSPQIRNVGTIGGNLANASPIGDFAPLLMALDAEIRIAGPQGCRSVEIANFFSGYKQTVLESDEIIVEVSIPLPGNGQSLRAFKISKRRNFDLAVVNAGICVGHDAGRILDARIALGGVAPQVKRLLATESFLSGRPFVLNTFVEAGRVLRSEIDPIPDVRGSAEYRFMLAENLLLKFFHEVSGDTTTLAREP